MAKGSKGIEKERPQVDVTERPEATTPGPQPGADAPVLTINDLKNVLIIIDTVTQRGAFRANEMATVGALYNKISAAVQAFADASVEQTAQGKQE